MSTDRHVEPRLADGSVGNCWRVDLAIRLGTGVAIIATGTIALISTAMTDNPMSDPLTMIAMYTAYWWFLLVRPAVWLSPNELVVRNPLRTHRIPRDNVVSARPGSRGIIIVRRDGRPCSALVFFYKPKVAKDRAAGLITYWAQTQPSSNQGEVPESSYAERRDSPPRLRVDDVLAATGFAIALTIPALLLAWPHNPEWLWPVASLTLAIAIVPFAIP